MHRKYIISLVGVFIITFMLIPSIAEFVDSKQSIEQVGSVHIHSAQEPIFITHDSNFTQVGFTGNGTESNPYVLSEANITAVGDYTCISISDTRSHFVISKTLIQGTQGHVSDYGIVFDNVTNGVIEDCLIRYRNRGVSVSTSQNITCRALTLRLFEASSELP